MLPSIYARAGCTPVARLGWSEEYAPAGWDHELYANYNAGRPDVVFMAHDPAAVDGTYQRGAGTRARTTTWGIARAAQRTA